MIIECVQVGIEHRSGTCRCQKKQSCCQTDIQKSKAVPQRKKSGNHRDQIDEHQKKAGYEFCVTNESQSDGLSFDPVKTCDHGGQKRWLRRIKVPRLLIVAPVSDLVDR